MVMYAHIHIRKIIYSNLNKHSRIQIMHVHALQRVIYRSYVAYITLHCRSKIEIWVKLTFNKSQMSSLCLQAQVFHPGYVHWHFYVSFRCQISRLAPTQARCAPDWTPEYFISLESNEICREQIIISFVLLLQQYIYCEIYHARKHIQRTLFSYNSYTAIIDKMPRCLFPERKIIHRAKEIQRNLEILVRLWNKMAPVFIFKHV